MQSLKELIEELNNEQQQASNNEESGRYVLPIAMRLIIRLLEEKPELAQLLEK